MDGGGIMSILELETLAAYGKGALTDHQSASMLLAPDDSRELRSLARHRWQQFEETTEEEV